MTNTNRTLFPLGRVLVSDEVFAALDSAREPLAEFLMRHQLGDWGMVNPEAHAWNEWALLDKTQYLRSVYRLSSGELLKVVTDAQRSATSITLL